MKTEQMLLDEIELAVEQIRKAQKKIRKDVKKGKISHAVAHERMTEIGVWSADVQRAMAAF